MKISAHAQMRMGQRGIPAALLGLVRKHGRVDGDRVVLDRREAKALLDQITAERAALLKVIDKGGIAVVEQGETIVTTYNLTERRWND